MPESSSAVPDQQPSQDRDRVLLVSVARAGEILSLSRSSIYQLIWTDQLTPVRIGRSVRFSVEHLEEFVAYRMADNQR
jgi:excisionase family DNA binding protein